MSFVTNLVLETAKLRNYARLCQNLELNLIKNVTVRKYGLGAAASLALASDPRPTGGVTLSGTIYGTIRRRADANFEQIEVTSLDQDLAEAHLPESDLIKVDGEGYELAVLEGAKRLLEAKHPALYWKCMVKPWAKNERT